MLAAWPTHMVLTSGFDKLHGIVDGQAGRNRPTRGIDIEMDILVGVFRFQKQQLGYDQVCDMILDGAHKEHHPLL